MPSVKAIMIKPAVILSLVGIMVLSPSILSGPGATHSHFYNFLWIEHFGKQMAAGHLYERWLPDSFEGMGSPTFYFYPPFAYLVAGALNALGLTVFQAINGAGLLLLIASGLTMHAWLSARGTRPLLGAILYMVAPYHLYDFLVRGALAEFAALIWLPLIALGIERLPHRRGLLLLALSYAALIITHLPLAMLAGLFLIVPMMIRRTWQDHGALLTGAMAGALALGLAAFFLLPAATLQEQVSSRLLWVEGYRATDWSIWTARFEMFPCLALGLILIAWPARSIWTVLTVVGALAAVGLIPFLWDIPLLNKAQFPWRLMGTVEFTAVTAMMSCRINRTALFGGAFFLTFPYMFLALITNAMLAFPVDYALISKIRPDAPEYLPKGFDVRLVKPIDRWTDLRTFRNLPRGDVVRVTQAGPVTLHRADFPIWRVTRDGVPVAHKGPLITFDARPGTYRIERVTIWQETAGLMISLAAALGLLLTQWPMRRGASCSQGDSRDSPPHAMGQP